MSPTGTAKNGNMRTGVRTARLRALAALVGAGVIAAVPLTVQAAGDGAGLLRGQVVAPGAKTPVVVKRALRGNGPVVVAFLLPGITEDEIVQKRLNKLQNEPKFHDTKFLIYRITRKSKLGDLPTMFGVRYTPAVAVIQGDNKLGNVWRGLVDEDIIAQSLIDARAAVPQPIAVPPRKGTASGSRAGISLAGRVNARYAKVPGVAIQFEGAVGGVTGAKGTGQIRIVDGRQRVFAAKATAGAGSLSVVINRTGLFTKVGAAACWTRYTNPKALRDIGDPVIPVRGVQFGAPVKSKDGTTLTVKATDTLGQYGGGQVDYTINAKTLDVVSQQSSSGAKMTATILATPPAIGRPQPIC